MKSHTMPYSQFFSVFIITLMMTLASCSVSKRPKQDNSVNNQLGAAIQIHLAASKASSELEITTALSKMKTSRSAKVIISKHRDSIIHLYSTDTLLLVIKNKYRDNEISEKLINFDDTPLAISTLISLFPIDAYRILTYATEKSLIDKRSLLAIAVENNLDPTIVLDATATGTENRVTPLIHSAGLVIYGQDEDSSSEVKYRKVGDNAWLPALKLAWEPIYGALSGSIVHLEPETQYEVEVIVTDYLKTKKQYFFDFKTRPNSPPIDPEKIYYLSEIYNGGQLDLEALNIYGDEHGYAKIIGDGTVIEAPEEYLSAVNIGSQAYIMLENLTIKGGQRYGIFAKNTHNIWIKGCNISEYGRIPTVFKNGKGYSSETSGTPINYDSGIYLEKTGVSVVEECEIHNPNHNANHWGYGHPNGPNALQVYAYHPDENYRGQIIVRNNRFYGTNTHRFNDVIEGRKNFHRTGGFIRDSAIYGNYLAFANDDLIEIDGGQRNVLVYENELTQGYSGISIAPNMLGPSYLFHNYIHDLGDERGKEWTAIKAGGLLAKPAGKSFVFENYINTDRNGIAASGVNGDTTFWVELRNNVIINHLLDNKVGLGIYDKEKYPFSYFINNFIYNTKALGAINEVLSANITPHPQSLDPSLINPFIESPSINLPISQSDWINNFSRNSSATFLPNAPQNEEFVLIDRDKLSKFHKQAKAGEFEVKNDSTLKLKGNIWYKIPFIYQPTKESVLSLEFKTEGEVEIVGIGLETNNYLTRSKVFQLEGSQVYGNPVTNIAVADNGFKRAEIKLGEYDLEEIKYIVFILDNDVDIDGTESEVEFRSLNFPNDASSEILFHSTVRIGL